LKSSARVEVDASPWGGGAALYLKGRPAEYFDIRWDESTARRLRAPIGEPCGQTSWELLAILLALCKWGTRFAQQGVIILGDNIASLEAALSLKGRSALAMIGRELAWRRARFAWRYHVGHLPTEANTVADALSRLHAPAGAESKALPACLSAAARVEAPDVESLWVCG